MVSSMIAVDGLSPDAPLVSVIVPVFNGRDFLEAAIDSALAQTVSLEIVVVDDGSTDGSGDIAATIAERHPRVRLIRQTNRGLAGARNVGLYQSRGMYVAFLDADDLWLPRKLETQVPFLGEDRVVFSDAFVMRGASTCEERIFARGTLDRPIDFERLLEHNLVPILTAVIGRRLLLDVGGFDEELRSVEDWDLWLRLCLTRDVEFVAIAEPLACYRVNPDGLSSDRVSMARWRLRVLQKLAASSEPTRRAVIRRAKSEKQLLAGELRARAWRLVADGSLVDARADLREAIRLAPRPAAVAKTLLLTTSAALLKWAAARSREAG